MARTKTDQKSRKVECEKIQLNIEIKEVREEKQKAQSITTKRDLQVQDLQSKIKELNRQLETEKSQAATVKEMLREEKKNRMKVEEDMHKIISSSE